MTPESAARLIAFLGARWDEEEAELDLLMGGALVQGYLRAHGERLKAEIAAKRQIVSDFTATSEWVREEEARGGHNTLVDMDARHAGSLLWVLRLFAEPHSDHKDYPALVGTVTL